MPVLNLELLAIASSFVWGVYVCFAFLKDKMIFKAMLALLVGSTPIFVTRLIFLDVEALLTQLWVWRVLVVWIWIAAFVSIVLALILKQCSGGKVLKVLTCVLLFGVYLLPLYREHIGWGGQHSHFLWETPFHFH